MKNTNKNQSKQEQGRKKSEVQPEKMKQSGEKIAGSNLGDITESKRGEEALHDSEERFRKVFGEGPIGMAISDKRYHFVQANPSFCRMLGYTEQELEKLTFIDITHPEDVKDSIKNVQELEKGNLSDFKTEKRYITKNKDVIWASLTLSTVLDKEGELQFYLVMIEDITERKQVEEALRLRMEQLVALSQASQAVATSLDLDQVLTEVTLLAGKVTASDYTTVVLVDEAGHISKGVENMPDVLSIERRARKRGFTSWILRARRPAVVDEIGEAGVIRPRVGEGAPRTANPDLVAKGIKSFVGLPLIVEERTVGVLYLHSLHPGTFHDQLTLLTTFASQAAIAIEKARLYDTVQKELAERKRAEEAQQQSELLFRALFELSPDAVVLIDPYDPNISWPIVDCNAAACLMNGYRRDELIGHSIDIVNITPGTQVERIAYMKQLLEAGNVKLETFHRHKNGTLFPVEVSTTLIKVGERELVMGIDRDITERKQAEEKLKESEEMFRSFIEQSSEGAVLLDEQGSIIEWNHAQEQITGIPRQQAIGVPFWDIQYQLLPPERRSERGPEFFKNAMLNAFRTGKFPTADELAEAIIYTSRNETKSILQASFPIKTETGYRVGSLVRDITERKRAEEALARQAEELRQRNEELARLYRASGSLLSGVSLSLQELAQTIVGAVQQEFGQANCSLLVIHRDSNELQRLAAAGPYTEQVKPGLGWARFGPTRYPYERGGQRWRRSLSH
jgi:PAS domain S-box-containing protein